MPRITNARKAVLGCILLAACDNSSAKNERPAQTASSTAASVPAPVDSCASPTFQRPVPLDGFHESETIQISSRDADTIIYRRKSQTKGIGWVYVTGPADNLPDGIEERILADTLPTAPMVAYLDFWPQCVGGWTVIEAARADSAHMYSDRLSEDYSGILATERHGPWVRVLYAWTPSGEPLFGWTRLVPGLVEFTDTADYDD